MLNVNCFLDVLGGMRFLPCPEAARISPSPLNGERAGVRGERIQWNSGARAVNTLGRGAAAHRSEDPHPPSLSPLRREGTASVAAMTLFHPLKSSRNFL